jgi:aerobic carbon-monoxide dehydrogenase large subunit
MAVVPKFIGERVKRREDPRLITGTATYVDDLRLPGMLHALVLRSPHAHAAINSIDVEAARKAPGVVVVLTGADLKDKIGTLPCAAIADHKPFHPVLAEGKVRYVGEPVAAVVAADPYKAQDALDLVEVDYDPLDAVVDPEKALEPGAPLIHETFGTNLVHRAEVPGPGVEQAMQKAHRIVRFRVVNQRLAPVPIEARGVVAQWHRASGQLTLWSSTQIPHLLRSALAGMLNLAENRTRVIAPEVGGGFGCKLNVYREEALTGTLRSLWASPSSGSSAVAKILPPRHTDAT